MVWFFYLALLIGGIRDQSERDLALMQRIKSRDEQALADLYDHYNRFLYGLIRTMIKRPSEAEDLLQEVFVKVWQQASSFDAERGNVYSWIVTMTRNLTIDRLRSKRFRKERKESYTMDDPNFVLSHDGRSPLQDTISSDRAHRVRQALSEIPDEQRKVIEIAYFWGMSQSEIAEHLEMPLGTVKTRMRLGMKKLKKLLAESNSTNEA